MLTIELQTYETPNMLHSSNHPSIFKNAEGMLLQGFLVRINLNTFLVFSHGLN